MSKTMWDASTPPAVQPPGFDAAAGYIGGDTPHVWTRTEWDRLGKTPKLPIWVRSDPASSTGRADALAALGQLQHIGAPPGCTVALDLETAIAPGFVTAFGIVMRFFGYHVWVYGSRSTVFSNPPLDGYWVADYTNIPHFAAGNGVRATQWEEGTIFDPSVIRYWQWRNRLWR